MPTFFNNGPSNKVAVAPQPQKRSNRHSSTAKEEIPRFRTQVSHSPYQMNSNELNGRATSNSRQNMVFSAPSEAQRLMMNEIIEKDVMIGQLKSRLQVLSARLERQQMEYDEEKSLTQKESIESRNRYLSVKK
uniref:Uncharacterized protein n=1 Tax=Panagrolaimus sp. ES5 TaxID=591445 RepID=A0AC34G9I4_9BILA